MEFQLNERLANGGYDFETVSGCRVLLKKNALYPWFVLVPEVSDEITELHQMERALYDAVTGLIYDLSAFIQEYFQCDKVNVGAVGSVVRQLHIHVVGRNEGDAAWPGVVWGCSVKEPYEDQKVEEIKQAFLNVFA